MTDQRNRRAEDRVPKWLLPALIALIALGALSVGLTFQSARESQLARASQVDRVERLIERLDTVADRNHRADQLGHRCLLEALRDIAADRPVVLPDECTPFDQED